MNFTWAQLNISLCVHFFDKEGVASNIRFKTLLKKFKKLDILQIDASTLHHKYLYPYTSLYLNESSVFHGIGHKNECERRR